jgi:hypothetical protein
MSCRAATQPTSSHHSFTVRVVFQITRRATAPLGMGPWQVRAWHRFCCPTMHGATSRDDAPVAVSEMLNTQWSVVGTAEPDV